MHASLIDELQDPTSQEIVLEGEHPPGLAGKLVEALHEVAATVNPSTQAVAVELRIYGGLQYTWHVAPVGGQYVQFGMEGWMSQLHWVGSLT